VLEVNVGLSRNTAIVVGGCLNLAFAFGSLVPALGADRLGRRKPMMFGAIGMGLSMMVVAILLSYSGTDKGKVTANVSIAFFITVSCALCSFFPTRLTTPSQYMLSFGASLNAIPWCYSTEILPLRIRAQGTALAVFNNWIWVLLFPYDSRPPRKNMLICPRFL
jgi:MFS family permease